LGFNIYRDGTLITDEPIAGATNFVDPDGDIDSRYLVTAMVGEREVSVTDEFQPRDEQYLDIPISSPGEGYRAADASVGDLDGDGTYEIIFSWNPANFPDNSIAGFTQSQYLDAYKLDGTQLWRIDLGRNIRAGAHYTQFQVFDYDSDGRAEIAFKTSDGVVDGTGRVLGDPEADHRNSTGYILSGPEWLSVFDGLTGAEIDTVEFIPQRGNVADWGDTYGNRVDRFLGATAYLDGEHPSLIMSRGYYTRTVIAAWDLVDGQLQSRWVFDSNEWGKEYEGQGNHNLAPADVDRDGLDEIVFGAMTIDDDGTPLYNSRLYHGDSLHVADHDPSRPGLEIFGALEDPAHNGGFGSALRDAETGEVIYATPASEDTGRGSAGDVDPNHPGNETWAIGGDVYNSPTGTMKNTAGEVISESIPPALFTSWWDGDLLREIPDVTEFNTTTQRGIPVVKKWNPETQTTEIILRDDELWSIDGTKAAPMIQADLLGDWREELLWPNQDYSAMRLYTTVDVTQTRLPTLMHDSQYRTGVAWQNTSYNQPPWPSYFLGTDMEEPPLANISYVGAPQDDTTPPVVSGLPSGTYTDSVDLVLDPVVEDAESGIRTRTTTLDGEAVVGGSAIDLTGRIGAHHVVVTATNHVGLTTTVESDFLVVRDDGATTAPGVGTLSNTSGWAYGLHDGNYDVVMNLWYGTPGSVLKIYENGTLIDTRALPATSGMSQTSGITITGKPNGTYVYTAELINLKGVTKTTTTTVKVTAANPGVPVISHDNKDGDGAFRLTANLWWGTNATQYRFELDGQVVGQGPLVARTPNAQQAVVDVSGIATGDHTAVVVFINAAGETASKPVTIRVTR
jgi:Rhamnogalacturonan I lyases beta-sheet domain